MMEPLADPRERQGRAPHSQFNSFHLNCSFRQKSSQIIGFRPPPRLGNPGSATGTCGQFSFSGGGGGREEFLGNQA